MKHFVLLFLLLILPLTSATRIDLLLNKSFVNDGRNISLIDINIAKEKALICINNEKAILSKGKPKTVNNVVLELRKTYKDKINLDAKVYCEDCECDTNCSNSDCITIDHIEIEREIKNENVETIVFENGKDTEVIENNGLKSLNTFWAILILVCLLVLLYFLLRKR